MTPPLELQLLPAIDLTREQFFQFCQLNRDVRIERNAEGSIAIMSPTGGETGARSGRRENGARLGWMIDPDRRRVTTYRAAGSVESRDRSISLSGEDVLRGFVLTLSTIWESAF